MVAFKHAIYWVEDSPPDQELIKIAFKRSLPETDELIRFFETGESLLEALSETNIYPKLTILDINLPGMSGLEVLKSLKRNEKYISIQVLMFSGSTSLSDIKSAYNNFSNGFLEKPSDFNELTSLTQHLVDFWLTRNITLPISNI